MLKDYLQMLAILNLLPVYWHLPKWVVASLDFLAFTPLSSIYCERPTHPPAVPRLAHYGL